MSKLTDLAKKLAQLKKDKQEAEGLLSSINNQIKAIATRSLIDAMEDAEITSFKVEGIGTIYIDDKVKSFVFADDRPATYQWYKDHGHEDLIVEYVWPSTENAWAKEQSNNGEELPPTMKLTYIPTAIIRRKT